jgi:hypothetical protein
MKAHKLYTLSEELKNSESEVDANGVKTVIEYKKDHKTAERIKVTPNLT